MDLPPATLVINGILIDFAGDRLRAADGSSIPLRPQSFAALRYLAVNANRLATKRELMEALWKDVAVTDDSLVQCVRDIRRALNDERHAILRTVPRRGYRLALPDLEPGASTEPSLKPSIAVLAFRSLTRGQAYFADGLVEEVTTHLSKIPGLFRHRRRASSERGRRPARDRCSARRPLSPRRQRPPRRPAPQDHRPAGRGRLGHADLGRQLRRRRRRCLRPAGPSDRGHRRTDRAHGPPRRDRPGTPQAARKPRCLRPLPPGAPRRVLERARRLRPRARAPRAVARARSRLSAGPRRHRLVPRAALLPRRLRPRRPRRRAPACRQRPRRQCRRPAGREHRRLRPRQSHPRLRRRDRGARPGARPQSQLRARLGLQRPGQRPQRAARAGGGARPKGLAPQPAERSAQLPPYCALGLTHLFAGRFADSIACATLAIHANPGFSMPHAYLVAAHVGLGDIDTARRAARRLLEVAPRFSVSGFVRMELFRPQLTAAIAAALTRAGLPETPAG